MQMAASREDGAAVPCSKGHATTQNSLIDGLRSCGHVMGACAASGKEFTHLN